MRILKKFFYWPIAVCQVPLLLALLYGEAKAIKKELEKIRKSLEH
jgi:hypothetical protein